MPSPDKLSIAKASIQASTKGDEPLAHLLRNVAEGMFGPVPKGISIEHWALINKASSVTPEQMADFKSEALDLIMKEQAPVLRALKDDEPNG